MAKREKLEGLTFGDFTTVEYLGKKKYRLVCNNCGEERELLATNIKRSVGVTCSKKKIVVDLEGDTIGEWEVLKYVGNKRYLCRCSCGKEVEVLKVNLLNGTSKSCGHKHNSYGDLTGKQFGEWEVLEKSGYLWKCRCSCGKIGNVTSKDLVSGRSKSCGHGYNEFYDISGEKYGLWEVLGYLGKGYYQCRCSCDNNTISSIKKADLLSGASTSCGCNKAAKAKDTLLERYNETAPNRVHNPRESEQIIAVSSKEKLIKFIDNLGYKPTSLQLANELGMQLHRTLTILHNFDMIDKVDFLTNTSNYEIEITDIISKLTDCEIIRNNRKILHGKELDIYIPSKRLAIEFNGTYWHSIIYKDEYYHQDKLMTCLKHGIRLIHIYEYEWIEENSRAKIENLLKTVLGTQLKELNADSLQVRPIDISEAQEFCKHNSLSSDTNGTIAIGGYYDTELIEVLLLNKLEDTEEYELINVGTKLGYNITNGLNTLWNFAKDTYGIAQAIYYLNPEKYNWGEYSKLGYEALDLTPPNKLSVGDLDIYDSGRLKMIYRV